MKDGPATLELEPPMSKKRNDRSVKIDAKVLLRIETVVTWLKNTELDDDKLSVAEFLSREMDAAIAARYAQAIKWLAQQSSKPARHKPTEGNS